MSEFQFLDFPDLQSEEIRLVLKSRDAPDPEKGIVPRYGFTILHLRDGEDIGTVYFAADTGRRQYLRGHLSYGVSPAYAGHHYAGKACLLVKRVALAHGFARLYIGSGRDNIASRKTIEWLGAVPIGRADVPDDGVLAALRRDAVDMYVWTIAP